MANFNPTYVQQLNSQLQTSSPSSGFGPIIARVTHVVQGPFLVGTNIEDVYYGNPNDLGIITFQVLSGVQDRTSNSGGNVVAKPFYSAVKQYPLEGEFVLVFPGPSINMNDSRGQRDYFYMLPYNMWNGSHHNAFPDLGDYTAFVNTTYRSYGDSLDTKQAVNVSATGSLNMPLGPNFAEKPNIRALRQFTGDVTVEGRWGNSIRFGSTAGIQRDQNTWSKQGEAGSPILIIRNGQGKQENNIPWIPTVENINRDPSSIYLTEGQEIVIDDINNNFSLASLDIASQRTVTLSVPIQQQLTSIDTISPNQQDQKIADSNKQ